MYPIHHYRLENGYFRSKIEIESSENMARNSEDLCGIATASIDKKVLVFSGRTIPF